MGLIDILNPVKAIAGLVNEVIGKFVTDPKQKLELQTKMLEAETSLTQQVIALETKLVESQASIVVAEAKSESWIAANWRPVTALSFVGIIVYNWMAGPIFSAPTVPIPSDLWDLLKIMIGGYVVSRGVEKGISNWNRGK